MVAAVVVEPQQQQQFQVREQFLGRHLRFLLHSGMADHSWTWPYYYYWIPHLLRSMVEERDRKREEGEEEEEEETPIP